MTDQYVPNISGSHVKRNTGKTELPRINRRPQDERRRHISHYGTHYHYRGRGSECVLNVVVKSAMDGFYENKAQERLSSSLLSFPLLLNGPLFTSNL